MNPKELDVSAIHGAEGRKWLVFSLIGLVVAVIAIGLLVWRKNARSAAVSYKTQAAERGDLTVIVTATGTLEPTNTVEVGSEISGTIKAVEADYNQRVKTGQVLARIDTTKLESQAKQSRAALESARAKVLQTQATVSEAESKLAQLRRVRELSKGKVPSQTEMDAAEAALARARADESSARASVSQAQAMLEANETDISKSVIRSPVNGVVLTRQVEPGQTVAASFTAPVLFTLAEDLSEMKLQVNVDEADVGQVREGQNATFTVDAYPDRVFQARITQTRYGSETVDGVVSYKTILKVKNSDLCLRPGMTATADITVKKIEQAILIPNAALRFTPAVQEQAKKQSGGLVGAIMPRPPRTQAAQKPVETNGSHKRVWVLRGGQPAAVDITAGLTNGSKTEVLKGDIQPGTELVTDAVSQKK